MALNFDNVLQSLVSGAQHEASQTWPQIQELVTQSLRDLAQTIIDVERIVLELRNEPNQDAIRAAASNVLNEARGAVEGALAAAIVGGQAAAQRIVNAALAAVQQVVNSAVGFAIL